MNPKLPDTSILDRLVDFESARAKKDKRLPQLILIAFFQHVPHIYLHVLAQ